MKAIKKPIKKAQTGSVVKDKTSVAKTRDVSKDLRYNKNSKKEKEAIKKVTSKYTVVAKPDPEAMFPGDSVRYYPGQRGGVGVPYIRDVGGKGGGLLGIDTKSSDRDFAKASKDKKNYRTYQDTLAVKANKDVMGNQKNGGKLVKKAKSGTTIAKAKDGKWMQKAAASIKRRGTAGKCTPITKKSCTGKAKTLALTFKKIAKSNKKK
jgi:hypothetical protein